MSPLVLLGSLGTVVSTVSMLPHLVHAIRNRRPAGSAFAWLFGAFSSGVWFAYGFAIGDILVAAPGFVTIPVSVSLAVWCRLSIRPARAVAPVVHEVETTPVYVPAAWEEALLSGRGGDTLEMPRVVA